MLDKRYQVFISTSGMEMKPERSIMMQTLVSMGFFSWGLEQRTPISSAISRRQIDDCDYVVFLLGSQYGELSVSGMGYMHLDYLYAVSRQKPIVVFMHEHPHMRDLCLRESKPERQEKFLQFRTQLQNEVEQVFTYRTLRDLELAVRFNMPQMLERYPVLGWVRPQNAQKLLDEIEQLKAKVASLETETGQREPDPIISLPKVSLHERFAFDYRIHAYQDGNFQEMKLSKQLTWAQLLGILGPTFIEATPEEFFSKRLNDYLNEVSLAEIKQQLPKVHAVARAQINTVALHNIKNQLSQNEWIVQAGRDDRQRMLWQTTHKAQKLIESHLLNNDRIFAFKPMH